MKRLLMLFVLLLFAAAACQSSSSEVAEEPAPPTATPIPPTATPIPPTPTPLPPTEEPAPETAVHADLAAALQAIVDSQIEAGFPSVVLMVDAPDLDFTWKGAGGMANEDAGVAMTPDTPFRTASVSKMLLSTMMLRMAEEGLLDLDDPISQYLDPSIIALLDGPDGEPYGEAITIRQLLNHTSGVADYFSPSAPAGARRFVDVFLEEPDKVWTPMSIIETAVAEVGPQFAPGESWDYSNTNFVLAGLIVEEITGVSLGEAYETWLFEPLGMSDTFFATYDDPRLSDVAHVYYYSVDASNYDSLSWQWGMAGVVSTASDLNTFMWAWVNDDIFTEPESKEAMTTWNSMAPAGFEGLYYGLGMIDIAFSEFGFTEVDEIMGHNGMFNSFLYYWPKQNMTIIGTLNDARSLDAYTLPVNMTFQAVLEMAAQ